MKGGKDPDCRRSVLWESLPEMQAKPLYAFIREMVGLRNSSPVLRDGKMEITCGGAHFAITRTLGKKSMTLSATISGDQPSFEIK